MLLKDEILSKVSKFHNFLFTKKLLFSLLIFITIFFIVIFFVINKSLVRNDIGDSRKNYTSQKNVMQNDMKESCVSNPQPVFTHDFTDLSKIEALGILGGAVGGSPGRSYVTVKKGEKVPVYNPMDAVLETIVWADRGSGQPEYGFYFRASCEVIYLLDHVEEISDDLKDLRPEKPASSTATQFGSQPNVLLKAGQLLGYTDGTPQARTFDFLLINKNKPTFHINPARWKWEQAVYADCPYEYYEESMKKQYFDLLGIPIEGGKLLKATDCGSPSADVVGTLSGGWFQGESTTEKGKRVMFEQQFNSMEMSIREAGSIRNFSLKQFDPLITPNKVTPGMTVCFQGYENNWVYINLISDTTLNLTTGTGQCPSSFPSSQAEIWIR